MDGRFPIGTLLGYRLVLSYRGLLSVYLYISRPGKTQPVNRGHHATRDSILLPAKTCEMRIGFLAFFFYDEINS